MCLSFLHEISFPPCASTLLRQPADRWASRAEQTDRIGVAASSTRRKCEGYADAEVSEIDTELNVDDAVDEGTQMHGMSASDPIALDGGVVDKGTQKHESLPLIPLPSMAM